MVVVLHSTCGDHYTYQLDGPEAIFLGEGDLHDTSYDYMEVDTEFAPFMQHNFSDTKEHCASTISVSILPQMMEDLFTSNKPVISTLLSLCFCSSSPMVFVFYDHLAEMRHNKVMMTAKRTNAIVASLSRQRP
jgi:hypothetical protein